MKNFYNHMKYKYGEHTCMYLKQFSKQKIKLAKQSQQLKYLLECKRYGLIPNHLSNTLKSTLINTTSDKVQQQIEKTKHHFFLKILNIEITQTNMNIKVTKDTIYNAHQQIRRTLNEDEFKAVVVKQNSLSNKIGKQSETTISSKIQKLKHEQIRKLGVSLNSEWFVNATNIEFPEDVKWLLSLGKKFTLPTTTNNFSSVQTIAEMEQVFETLETEKEKEVARNKLSNRIMNFKRNIRHNSVEKFILETYRKTKAFLKTHKDDIVITDSDKGNKTIALYKMDYNTKMENLLGDKNTYKVVRGDPTNTLQRKNNNIVYELYKGKHISLREKQQLTSTAATAPRLYGLPKIHKPECPLRPIVSCTNVPCYQLSKFIGKILISLISPELNIKNSYELKERLNNINVCEKDVLVSFDVVSLFTNIPTNLASKIIMRKWEEIAKNTTISKSKFQSILDFCLKDNNYFTHNDKMYTQTYGMPMGNPLSPTIADIVMDDVLNFTFMELQKQHGIQIKFLVKYVDDIFAIIEKDDANIILDTLNKYHNKLKFTIEKEVNGSIPFLDTRIHNNNNNLILDWYSKPTASGRLMNYFSSQPFKYKINTANNFIHKVLSISHQQFHETNVRNIKNTLKKNNYPDYLITNLIDKKLMDIKNTTKQTPNIDNQTKRYFSVTYIPRLTESLAHDHNNKRTSHTTLAFKSNCTLATCFTKTKSPIDIQQQSNVVYEIQCKGNDSENCNKVYIGTTKRTLGTRLAEHEADIRKQKQSTALSQHAVTNNHTAYFANTRILDKEKREKTRYTIESLRILQKREHTINRREDTDNIAASYLLCL
ncbi:uncharacterized protein DPCoAC isoform X1 [Eurosta solidaginis]|uniref:uncharacterized protein DPCoAC isoform X1 n=1 Tax=Eurosta solidaginis TaxID=178769 RepID=UPI0035310E38